ncbi:hypothetical protein JW979_15150, partial [bacterium]|nr:hypothetical protein [candidate division CSSED10-310 bacterium]
MAEQDELTSISRVLYYRGQALTAKDFQDEQRYHSEKLRQLLMRFPPGVIWGMKVSKQETDIIGVKITCGVGVNKSGELLCIFPGQEVFLNEHAIPLKVGTIPNDNEDCVFIPASELNFGSASKLYINISFRENQRIEKVSLFDSNYKNNRADETITIQTESIPAMEDKKITIGILKKVNDESLIFNIDQNSEERFDAKVMYEKDVIFNDNNGHDHSGEQGKGTAIGTNGLKNGAVTFEKIKSGVLTAQGDIEGTLPNLSIGSLKIDSAKIANKAITLEKLADEVINAGGDLIGTFPQPTIKDGAIISDMIALWDGASLPNADDGKGIKTSHIRDGAITKNKLDQTIRFPPTGQAQGDLTGEYPNPKIAEWDGVSLPNADDGTGIKTSHIRNGAITNEKIDSSVGFPPTGLAKGDLIGEYPNPKIAQWDGKSMPNDPNSGTGIRTSHIRNGAITKEKIDANVSFSPTGTAGGDLTGVYPNPMIALWDGISFPDDPNKGTGIRTSHIRDGAITKEKIDSKMIFHPSGKAGGDLTGEYPNPKIAEWDRESLPDDPKKGTGIRTSQIRNNAVRSEKLDLFYDFAEYSLKNSENIKYTAEIQICTNALFQIIPLTPGSVSWTIVETTYDEKYKNYLTNKIEISIRNAPIVAIKFRMIKYGLCLEN